MGFERANRQEGEAVGEEEHRPEKTTGKIRISKEFEWYASEIQNRESSSGKKSRTATKHSLGRKQRGRKGIQPSGGRSPDVPRTQRTVRKTGRCHSLREYGKRNGGPLPLGTRAVIFYLKRREKGGEEPRAIKNPRSDVSVGGRAETLITLPPEWGEKRGEKNEGKEKKEQEYSLCEKKKRELTSSRRSNKTAKFQANVSPYRGA